jgi:hypothetical protein
MKIHLKSAIAAVALAALSTEASAASFDGQLVNGTISSPSSFFTPGPPMPFSSPVIIGPGVDFSSSGLTPDGPDGVQNWTFLADFSGNMLTVTLDRPPQRLGNNHFGPPDIEFFFSGFSGVMPLRLLSYTCALSTSCNGMPNSYIVTSTASEFNVQFITLVGHETYVFGPQPPEPLAVPEPASWALMIAGFGLVGAAMRRRARVRVAYA